MKNNSTFIPKELKNINEPLKGFMLLSVSYFKVANELKNSHISQSKNSLGHSQYVFPSIIMYVASVEASFSESIAGKIEKSTYPKEQEELVSLSLRNKHL